MASNPYLVNPANPLQALMAGQQGYDFGNRVKVQGQQDEARNLAAQTILGGGDSRSALARLIQGGDIAGANAVANFGNQSAQQDYQRGMLAVAQQNANRQETPADVQKLRAAGIPPGTPAAAKALFPRTDTPISATDKKAIFEAEDALPQIKGTLEALTRAKDLNSQTFSGAAAGARAWLGSNLPDMAVPDFIADKKTADKTTEWQKIMGPEALQQMASTLKGATTDFELRQFIDMLGNPSTPPHVRAKVIDQMTKLAQRKLELNESRVKDLRGGTYFNPQGGQPKPAGDPLAMARDAIAKGAPREAVIQRLQQNGIDPSGL